MKNLHTAINKFNDKLALKITSAVGSMYCAYVFTIISLVSLPSALISGNVIVIVSWVAQTFLQLVLLSVILKGQNIQGENLQCIFDRIDTNTKTTEPIAERIEVMAARIEAIAERIECVVQAVKCDEDKELATLEKEFNETLNT